MAGHDDMVSIAFTSGNVSAGWYETTIACCQAAAAMVLRRQFGRSV